MNKQNNQDMVTVNIPRSIRDRAKNYALRHGLKLWKVISDGTLGYLDYHEKTESSK